MDALAQLTITDGPDRGQAFPIADDLVHVGRGAENQVVLSAPDIADHQASIVRRQNRFAIFAPDQTRVVVDGNPIPTERWVWLPASATIQLGSETSMRFEASQPAHDVPPTEPPAGTATDGKKAEGATDNGKRRRNGNAQSSQSIRTRKPRQTARKAQVARFITDRQGETLVRLGEDGHLPELHLSESDKPQKSDRPQRQQSPVVLYAVLSTSFFLSLALLLIDPDPARTGSRDTSSARAVVQEFYGTPDSEPEPYQKLLRQALIERSQGDGREEKRLYRQVLRMLNSADIVDPHNLNGLTGKQTGRGRSSDEDLRAALETLLAE
ncbi:MAG: FHA domain-containing protein [Maioricimonas sp. JB045]